MCTVGLSSGERASLDGGSVAAPAVAGGSTGRAPRRLPGYCPPGENRPIEQEHAPVVLRMPSIE